MFCKCWHDKPAHAHYSRGSACSALGCHCTRYRPSVLALLTRTPPHNRDNGAVNTVVRLSDHRRNRGAR